MFPFIQLLFVTCNTYFSKSWINGNEPKKEPNVSKETYEATKRVIREISGLKCGPGQYIHVYVQQLILFPYISFKNENEQKILLLFLTEIKI
jgi:hypothetical protein